MPLTTTEQLSDRAVAELQADPKIQLVVPTMPVRLIGPISGDSMSLASNWGIKAVRTDKSPCDGSGVNVAILDTGIDTDHPAFAGVKLVEKDVSEHGNGDRNGHGTHCVGTFFGRNDDGRPQASRVGCSTRSSARCWATTAWASPK